MIKSVFRKIVNNFWLFFCLILGSLLITSVLTAIPIYTDGALRKMLTVELDDFASGGDGYVAPGEVYASINMRGEYTAYGKVSTIEETNDYISDIFDNIGLEVKESFSRLTVSNIASADPTLRGGAYNLRYMSGMEKHMEIVAGRMYEDGIQEDGSIEVIVSSTEYNKNFYTLDTTYTMTHGYGDEPHVFMFKIVGVFEPEYNDYDYWRSSDIQDGLTASLFTSGKNFSECITNGYPDGLSAAEWYYNINLFGLKGSELDPYISLKDKLDSYFEKLPQNSGRVSIPVNSTLVEYMDKCNMLQLTMWILNVPVLIMLLFYTYMVAKMIIDDDKNEISSLKCRGAYPTQIFLRYFIECCIITLLSLVAGPPLGLAMSQAIGSANGFLEFVNRSGMELSLLPSAYLYAFAAGIVFMIMVLIPAYKATKTTIVQHKQKKARKNKKPFWEKAFFDVILFAASLYLIRLYQIQEIREYLVKDNGSDMTSYFISTAFIFACGMLFLRIYPYIIKLIYRITRKKLPPTLYATFVQVSRNGNENRFLIMFLILTMAVGIYSSNTAGVINTNAEDIAKYKSGADITLTPDWNLDTVITYTAEDGSTVTGTLADMPANYRTFSDDSYMQADGIEAMTRVANLRGTFARRQLHPQWERNVRVMAIEPYKFSQVSWIRSSTFNKDIHWYYYINLMQEYPNGVLISNELADACDLHVGNTLELSFLNTRIDEDGDLLPDVGLYVLGTFDYWPTFYGEYKYAENTDLMIVANLDYMLTIDDSITYDLWFKKTENVSSEKIYSEWEKAGLTENVKEIEDYQTYLNKEKSDSLVMALNGLFSMSFVASIIISFMGFLLYWMLSVRKRRLQFGVLRAMGLSKFKLSLMLFWEHLMTSGVAAAFGIFVGYLTSWLFMPILRITFSSLLPLTLLYNQHDNIKVYVIFAVMIIGGIVVLSRYISRLKINEAVKIGEE